MSGTFCDKFNNIRDLSIHDFNIRELNIRSCTALCAAQSGAGVPLICCVVEAQPGVSPTQGTSRQMCPPHRELSGRCVPGHTEPPGKCVPQHGTCRQVCSAQLGCADSPVCPTNLCMSLGYADSPLCPTNLCHLGVLTVPSVPRTCATWVC